MSRPKVRCFYPLRNWDSGNGKLATLTVTFAGHIAKGSANCKEMMNRHWQEDTP
jgi:hypothetical protein